MFRRRFRWTTRYISPLVFSPCDVRLSAYRLHSLSDSESAHSVRYCGAHYVCYTTTSSAIEDVCSSHSPCQRQLPPLNRGFHERRIGSRYIRPMRCTTKLGAYSSSTGVFRCLRIGRKVHQCFRLEGPSRNRHVRSVRSSGQCCDPIGSFLHTGLGALLMVLYNLYQTR